MSNSKKRVLLVNNVIYLPGEGGYKRTMFMFDMMKSMGYEVTLITGDFNHYKKEARDVEEFRRKYPEYKDIKFLHMPVYTKNVSFRRIYSEKYWARKLKKWLKENINQFDVIFFSDIDYNLPVDSICNKHHVKKIIDIRDLRPEVFRVIIKNELVYKILSFPMKIKADKAYACADELVAVSKEYLDRGLQTNKKSKNPVVVYLGSTLEKFYTGVEKYSENIRKNDGEKWIIYAGTLGESYDLMTLIKAAKKIEKERGDLIRFKILGQGPDEEKLKKYARSIDVKNVDWIGFQPYEKMAAYLCKSDITINALKKNASQSIINKVADYFAAGIPILNGSCCKEMQELVIENNVGYNYEAENVDSLVEYICLLIDNPEKCKEFGKNAKKLALEKFDRRTSYLEILKRIDEI
ncbi:glycosyltransferase family 4 protein [uncultured Eubacterium sp.]|mgnify:CR=1 FL=1|uniref:glycosyltransferase family 4 protein n=1 Tax=uncultured Eubacterium sp. TaxID=165185 RepID=UPI0025E09A48|nr:glycosyltransferase family 4 protein [uncultured Eubacterium sp.]